MKEITNAHIQRLRKIKKRTDAGHTISGVEVKFLLDLIEHISALALGKVPK